MREFISIFLAVALPLSSSAAPYPAVAPSVSAKSAVLMSDTGVLIYALNEDQPLPIASTTKLMTALVTIRSCELDESVEILPSCCGIEGSSMYLKPGEVLSVRELLTGLLLVSGNDAACALACHVAGDLDRFSDQMNQTAFEIGMEHSHFLNPHGLSEPEHYATALDLAILMREVLLEPELVRILSMSSAEIDGRTLVNHNKLLYRYPGCIGGKTGYTKLAGRCLVSCVERENTCLICVTLNDPDDWDDHCALYDWGFSQYQTLVFDPKSDSYQIPLLGGASETAFCVPEEECRLFARKSSEFIVKVELPFYVFAPVRERSPAGSILILSGDEVLACIPLVYERAYPVR